MPANHNLNVVLCWHMHQPEYRDRRTGIYQRPWTYLRAIKDYTDMAAHLEQVPDAQAVINFAPVLLEQINDYSAQLDGYFNHATALRDPLLSALSQQKFNKDIAFRQALLDTCLNGHVQRATGLHENYALLHDFAADLARHPTRIRYANEIFFSDLLVWYHLGWLGETVRRNDPRVWQLLEKGHGFSYADRISLLSVIGEQIKAVIPRYRTLAATPRVELSMTPYAHPLAPLLADFHSAREASPNLPLPRSAEYPGGIDRLRWHIDAGKQVFKACFGQPPTGCWPAEGAISDTVLALLDEAGFTWAASGSGVLFNSLDKSTSALGTDHALYHAYNVDELAVTCFFRDDRLSDLIGFTYSSWHADDAVANLIHHLESISARCGKEDNVLVAIIMDGENAWEHYPDNGFYFLQGLYQRLSSHPKFNLTTFSQCLTGSKYTLPHVSAGSWIYGDLTTWIGSPDKNRAWDMLVEAKQAFDRAEREQRLTGSQLDAARQQLGICEGSDWFWWPGDYNAGDAVAAFDNLFRIQLGTLYDIIEEPQPQYLANAFTHPRSNDSPTSGVMRKAQ
ncbi:MAG TPA: glycoside hydrolase [Porticoccaceae bacterium]|nr:glycoside hydrolase [Porticoccaceae bacterium]